MKFWKKDLTGKIFLTFSYLNTSYFVYLAIWIIVVYGVFFTSFKYFPHKESLNFFDNLRNWDGGHFIGIAKNGYSENYQYAFFPIYPILIKFVQYLIPSYLISAVFVSIFSTFLGIYFLAKLIKLELPKISSKKVIFFLLIFPTSFYLIIPYSEGVFFFFTTASFYFYRLSKSRNRNLNLFLACFFASLASATRIEAVAVAIAILIDLYLAKKIKQDFWTVPIILSGMVFLSIFLYSQTKDPFYFLSAETHWQRSLSLPIAGFWQSLVYVFSHNFDNFVQITLIDILFAVFGVGMVIRAFRFLPFLLSSYALISILMPLSTSTLVSIPRFLLPIFPIFLLLSMIKNRYVSYIYILVSIILSIYFQVKFINGYWVS